MNIDYVDFMLSQKYAADERAEKIEELFTKDMDELQGEINAIVERAKSVAKYYDEEYMMDFDVYDYLTL